MHKGLRRFEFQLIMVWCLKGLQAFEVYVFKRLGALELGVSGANKGLRGLTALRLQN